MAKDTEPASGGVPDFLREIERNGLSPGMIVGEVDYTTMSQADLFEELGKAYKAKDFKLMGKLSSLVAKAEAAEAKAKKDALLEELIVTTQETTTRLVEEIDQMVEEGMLEGAEGVWLAYDFGAIREKGINPACRLIKTGRKATGEGGVSGKSSYIANPAKSTELLAQVGDNIMFKENTTVTIAKESQVMPAGTTFKTAYDHSTNGGWRNRVRMALLKEAGII